jgi:molybdopterin converting factor small subunit
VIITVYLHTILQRQTPDGLKNRLEVKIPPGSTAVDLLKALKVDMDINSLLLVVNGRSAELTQLLNDGDQVNLIPAISGG